MSKHRAEIIAPHGRQVPGPTTRSVGIERIDERFVSCVGRFLSYGVRKTRWIGILDSGGPISLRRGPVVTPVHLTRTQPSFISDHMGEGEDAAPEADRLDTTFEIQWEFAAARLQRNFRRRTLATLNQALAKSCDAVTA